MVLNIVESQNLHLLTAWILRLLRISELDRLTHCWRTLNNMKHVGLKVPGPALI